MTSALRVNRSYCFWLQKIQFQRNDTQLFRRAVRIILSYTYMGQAERRYESVAIEGVQLSFFVQFGLRAHKVVLFLIYRRSMEGCLKSGPGSTYYLYLPSLPPVVLVQISIDLGRASPPGPFPSSVSLSISKPIQNFVRPPVPDILRQWLYHFNVLFLIFPYQFCNSNYFLDKGFVNFSSYMHLPNSLSTRLVPWNTDSWFRCLCRLTLLSLLKSTSYLQHSCSFPGRYSIIPKEQDYGGFADV